MSSISTKTGDQGTTALFGGIRVDKDHPRIECNGLIDEANARIGQLIVEIGDGHPWEKGLLAIQRDIMLMMSHIATPQNCPKENKKPHPEKGVAACEQWAEDLKEEMKGEKLAFVLPGGTPISALCHMVRTAVRTAERQLVTLNKQETLKPYILSYFNRLSDLFYLLAMSEMKKQGSKIQKFMVFPSQKSK